MTILYICLWIITYIFYPRVNYLSYIIKNEKDKQEREFIKTNESIYKIGKSLK